ncbi:hypothetical protein QZH41_004937 [Actinostola sp. cb2023]|nr:hypothetical protein QZH41_004937 [Actinostola sp. cb2023]
MDDPSRIAFTTLEDHSAREWIQVFEQESRVSFDIFDGPLWRVTMLKEHYDEEQKQYENSLMFTFHHMICDGGAIMALYAQFLEYLNGLQQDKDVKVESMTLLPPCSYLMRQKLQPSTFEKVLFILLPTWMKIKSLFVKPAKNLFMKVFPPTIMQDPSIVKRTSIVPKVIKAEWFSKMIKIGKQHNCKVHAIITAATRLAMAQILQSGTGNLLPIPLHFVSSFNVSMRKDCQPEVGMDEFGSFTSVVSMDIPTPCSLKCTPVAFWKFVQECNDAVQKKLEANEQYQMLKMFENVDFQAFFSTMISTDISNGGRFNNAFNISNRGRFTIGNTSNSVPFQFAGTYFAMAEQHIGPPLCNNIVSVNGDLYWGLIYFPNITTKKQAEQFIELSLSILREACSSAD